MALDEVSAGLHDDCLLPTYLVLGGFLESSWHDCWQRQHEWVRQLQLRGNVLYLERAAAGRIGLMRVVGRLRKTIQGSSEQRYECAFPASPQFVQWAQVPSNALFLPHLSARSALQAAERVRVRLGWGPLALIHVGTPAETWIELAHFSEVPVWFDMAERFSYSPAYVHVPHKKMALQISDSALVTTDTAITRDDWPVYADDVLVVPHGGKSWASEPDWTAPRHEIAYVGTNHPALDYELLGQLSSLAGRTITMIGEFAREAPRHQGLTYAGWVGGGDVPRRLSTVQAGLVPYQGGRWREGIYPSKVYDYWLAGVPALTTRLPALDGLQWAWQCEDAPSFCAAVQRAASLAIDDRKKIRAYALQNTWDVRFEAIAMRLHASGVPGFAEAML